MSSLFHDGNCSGTQGAAGTKCKGCVCETLNQLANRRTGDICRMGRPQRILVVNKGTRLPLFLEGSTEPTEFTVVDFDPQNCCAILTYEVPVADPTDTRETRTYITDCRSIAGISCIED